MLVAASLGLGTRLVTELTVYMKSLISVELELAFAVRSIVRGVAKTRAQAITAG